MNHEQINELVNHYLASGGLVTSFPYDTTKETKMVSFPFCKGYVSILSPVNDAKRYRELVKDQEIHRLTILAQAQTG